MSISLGTTEFDYAAQHRKATGKLLGLLKEHHDYSIPVIRQQVIEIKQSGPVEMPVEIPTEDSAAPEFSVGDWVARQHSLNPLPKLWFSIEAEIEPRVPIGPRVDQIIQSAAKHFGITKADIVSGRRTANIVRPRQIVYYLARHMTLRSLPEIARRIGGRDHTSALSGIRKITRLRLTDQALDSDIRAIASTLGGGIA